MREFHKPVRRPGDFLESLVGAGDPSESLAHDSAAALLHRVRAAADPQLAERIVGYAAEHGVDDVAELWAGRPADSLPGALWRVYSLRHIVAGDAEHAGLLHRAGQPLASDVDAAVAGAPHLPAPDDVVRVADEVLAGAFVGDFAAALDRAAAFCRVQAAGAESLGELSDGYARYAEELGRAAQLWRAGKLS
ncbi:DNA-directed RNA polymerase subunit beta [Tessaracoccus sp. OH4464_COT-324]|uniref:DNA-directed RNA polymerase subunit beta n=1 Tax=Tessaracoccus sp. OH4464_COT-324 TaxID=2491059 RepID=UPI000F63883A|nr:DNA-directed RNA polymerase subunit beta [Tessaracoccus sp. OH4464_COT-324]RRD46737.1 DNA-directed RNA polymerase subunit beta [Tessaracoccus sp. OH4464_COT-324]